MRGEKLVVMSPTLIGLHTVYSYFPSSLKYSSLSTLHFGETNSVGDRFFLGDIHVPHPTNFIQSLYTSPFGMIFSLIIGSCISGQGLVNRYLCTYHWPLIKDPLPYPSLSSRRRHKRVNVVPTFATTQGFSSTSFVIYLTP